MTEAREALLRKIRAMLAKAAATTNEAEAMAFMEKAQAWLAQHNISREELEAEHDYIVDTVPTPGLTDWEGRVNMALARLYFCRYFVVRIRDTDVHSFCGEEHNVRVCKAMSEYAIEFLAQRAEAALGERSGEDAPRYATEAGDKELAIYEVSFLHQASVTLADRIRRRILASMVDGIKSNGTTLPALMDAYVQTQEKIDQFLKDQLGVGAGHTLPALDRWDEQGLEDGEAAGEAVGLDTQIGVTEERKRLK